MAQTMSLKEMGFDGKNAEQVERKLHTYYSKDEEERYGVVVFKIQLINKKVPIGTFLFYKHYIST